MNLKGTELQLAKNIVSAILSYHGTEKKRKDMAKKKKPTGMQAQSIKKYLKDYKIAGRWTTFNGAIQHALAVPEIYDEEKVKKLLKVLGQENEKELRCTYCAKKAATWDHLHSNVKDKKFSGRGNRIFNLVPACRSCNEKKGRKHWSVFIEGNKNKSVIEKRLKKLDSIFEAEIHSWDRIQEICPELAKKYAEMTDKLKEDIAKMDALAGEIRNSVKGHIS